MLPRSDPKNRIDPACPLDLTREVDVALAANLVGKGIYAGDTLPDAVVRYCPDIFTITAVHGFELRFDMPENTHKALCRGRLYYRIRRATTH